MDLKCIKFRNEIKNFDGAVFLKSHEHIEKCPVCREYIKKNFPELQFSELGRKKASSFTLSDIMVTREKTMREWYGNVAKIAAVLVMIIGISSVLFYSVYDDDVQVEKIIEISDFSVKSELDIFPAPSLNEASEIVRSVSLEEKFKVINPLQSGTDNYLEMKYPLVEKAGPESLNYMIEKSVDGSRMVFFQIRSCVDL